MVYDWRVRIRNGNGGIVLATCMRMLMGIFYLIIKRRLVYTSIMRSHIHVYDVHVYD